ncbi:protein-glutamate O-methyltransferase CheR, partial [Arthrospira platensis SPKY1]|nr:protein-glutamate O-methyltransferase CheR [Arthrospira platensis SPKY1]
ISDTDFNQFRQLMRRIAGVELPSTKKQMVSGRLNRRLRACGLASFGDYYRLVNSGQQPDELERVVDLLTTHETYFFREPRHFEVLSQAVLPTLPRGGPLRFWSAASSTGEEAYTLAMVLSDQIGDKARWEILGSDISLEVLERARKGVYSMNRIDGIPRDYLRRFCLRGVGESAGNLMIAPEVRQRVRFDRINLSSDLSSVGFFDVVFLRNVLIYFDTAGKREIVSRIARQMRPGSWLFIGHSETLTGMDLPFNQEMP